MTAESDDSFWVYCVKAPVAVELVDLQDTDPRRTTEWVLLKVGKADRGKALHRLYELDLCWNKVSGTQLDVPKDSSSVLSDDDEDSQLQDALKDSDGKANADLGFLLWRDSSKHTSASTMTETFVRSFMGASVPKSAIQHLVSEWNKTKKAFTRNGKEVDPAHKRVGNVELATIGWTEYVLADKRLFDKGREEGLRPTLDAGLEDLRAAVSDPFVYARVPTTVKVSVRDGSRSTKFTACLDVPVALDSSTMDNIGRLLPAAGGAGREGDEGRAAGGGGSGRRPPADEGT